MRARGARTLAKAVALAGGASLVAAGALAAQGATDSTYASPALRELVAATALANHAPPSLHSYRARLETEMAVVLGLSPRGGTVTENAAQLEQVESAVSWRAGIVRQHVIGYRARSITPTISALSALRRPWIVPTLYGDRMQIVTGGEASEAVHPLAADRDAAYRFAGGDTVEVVTVGGRRRIPIVRVLVEPRPASGARRTLLFRGELFVDASRHQLVRMRGQLLVAGGHPSIAARVVGLGLRAFAFVDLVSGEYDGTYWLPTYQRIEAQGRSPVSAAFRPVLRVVSRFRDLAVNDTSDVDSGTRGRLTYASRDSLSAFADWRDELGSATADVRATDFDDVAPPEWRSGGPPFVDLKADRVSDVFRFNRVEGLYLGPSATLRFRDRAPGLVVGAYGGLAFAERTARGAAFAERTRGRTRLGVRAERALESTNDFRAPFDYEQSIMALLITADDADYVDRRRATAWAARELGGGGGAVVRLEAGPASDRGERRRVRYGIIHLDSSFRENRPVDEGSYLRTAASLDVHPSVSGDFVEPGVGGALRYERGDGGLQWQRVESRLVARHVAGAVTYAARADAAAVFGRHPPPQQLLELGENEGLHGYAYKEFGGDRAVLLRGSVAYGLPLLRAPLRAFRLTLPSLSPSIALGSEAGWVDAAGAGTREALARFGTRTDSVTGAQIPATRPTGGVKSSASLTLRVFGNALGIGVARPLGRGGAWTFVVGVGQGP